jgi:hypothetical protein
MINNNNTLRRSHLLFNVFNFKFNVLQMYSRISSNHYTTEIRFVAIYDVIFNLN